MKTFKKFLSALLAGLLAFTPPLAYPAFDPVNDDTDIFLANPNITALRPNVLLAVDNTANWSQAFVNERSALVSVVNGLKDGEFNVGLMMMAETGVGNDNVDGAYVRFHVRQMIGTAKSNLATMVSNLDTNNDRSNNAGHGQALYEAYQYFAGLPAVGGVGKVKADHDGTTDTLLTPFASPNHALPGPDPGNPARPLAGSTYRSPIADTCAKNFVILISNGKADTGNAEIATMEGRVQGLTGTNAVLPVENGGQRAGNWSDEMAKFMAGVDLDGSTTNGSLQNITTYVVEVDRGSQPEDLEWTEVMKNTATQGGGKYFSVSSNASGAAIIDALNAIFSEIQAVNTVFAATTLPVSVNVRGTNLNQVYVGVFRPDAKKAPRWLGNLKMYQLALDSQNRVFLADSTGAATENLSTGFVLSTARSFWTTDSGPFWQFAVTADNPNGAGGALDIPDGDLVEKGGAAQQVRMSYPNAQTPQGLETLRRVYTCTDGGTFAEQCTPTPDAGVTAGKQLSLMPFADNNTDITTASLGLGTVDVSPLTGFETKTVTNLTDRRAVSLTNADPLSSVSVTGFSNGGTTVAVTGSGTPASNLKTSTPKVVESISGIVSGTVTVNITSITKSGGDFRVLVGAGLSGVAVGTVLPAINCTGGANAFTDFNSLSAANRTVNGVTSVTDFTIPGPTGGPTPSCTGGTLQGPGLIASNFITVGLTSHGFTAGNPVTIAGATTFPNLNGTTTGISTPSADTFTFSPLPGGGTAGVELGAVTAAANTTTAVATSTAHGFLVGSTLALTIYGASPSGYNGSVAAFIIDANTFRYTVGSLLPDNTSPTVYAVSGGSTTVTVSAAGHAFNNGDSVTIAGASIPEYNGTFTISNVVLGVSFDYTPSASILPANTGGTVTASSGGSTLSTVTATVANHGFADGSTIVIEGAAPHAGTWGPITLDPVDPANTFSYSTIAALAAPSGSYTVRSSTAPKAYATVTGHGYANGNQVLIAGAIDAGYNGTKTIAVVDANTFTYDIAGALGPNTGPTVTSSLKSTTARATAFAHGFGAAGTTASVTITGAVSETSPSPFNGTHTVTIVDANSFTYPISTAQG
ncbi:MAG TPA: hypothetical protein VGA66_08425, partial [Mycobacterium sp.]